MPITKVTNVRTMHSVMADILLGKETFSEVLQLVKISYTIPVTSSTAERSFSALRRLKTFLRITMTQSRLNHAMTLHVHMERTNEIALD